jgi:hypothetical protein
MAIRNTQQARQMYNKGSKKPVKQAGVKNFLGKQEMVTAPKFWLSEPDHVKAKLAYITDEEEKILIDKNLYGSLKGKPNIGPAGLPSLQGGDFGSEDAGTGDSHGGGDKGGTGKGRDLDFQQRGMTKGDYATGRGAGRGGDRDQNFGGRQNIFEKTFNTAKDFLPENGEGGLMVLDDTKPVCAGFLYISNSKVAWVEWIISDKNYKKKDKALNLLLDTLILTSKNLNMKYIFATNDNKTLIKRFVGKGFQKGSTTTELIKVI